MFCTHPVDNAQNTTQDIYLSAVQLRSVENLPQGAHHPARLVPVKETDRLKGVLEVAIELLEVFGRSKFPACRRNGSLQSDKELISHNHDSMRKVQRGEIMGRGNCYDLVTESKLIVGEAVYLIAENDGDVVPWDKRCDMF